MAILGDVKRYAGRGREVLEGFTLGQRAVVAVGVVIIALGAMFLSKWSSKPSYVPLFTNLAAKDASAITTKLDGEHVPYSLAEGGTAVEVPAAQVYKLRLEMAAANLPSGDNGSNTGYDLLDKQGLSTNDFTQHVDYQRAVQGELQNTIEAIDGVSSATVNLTIPTDDVFASDTGKPSASVLISTSGSNSLSSQQVQAIVHLVASSVQGMTADEVTVADSTGKLLSAPGMDAGASADARTEETTAVQNQLQQAATDILNPVLGQGHSVVRVNADLDLDASSYQESTYGDPSASPIPLNVATSSENYSGTGSSTTVGVLGPNPSSSASPGGNGSYSKTGNSQDNAVNLRNTTTNVAPGDVKRLSVSVLVDQSVLPPGVTTAQLQAEVEQAVGMQASRGDTIQVSAMKFNGNAVSPFKSTSGGSKSSLFGKLGIAIPVLGLILVLLAAVRGVRKVERTPLLNPQERLELEAARRALAAVERRQLEEASTLDHPAELEAGGGLPTNKMAEDLGELADSQPDDVADLLRNWLSEAR